MKDNKQKQTDLVFILDKSGSMYGLEADTIGGFNSMIAKQKAEGAAEGTDVYVTTVLFSDEWKVIHDRMPIGEVPQMTERDYWTGGCTALLDAVGETIERIGQIHRYMESIADAGKTLFVITTDGLENASRKFDYAKVRRTIEQKKELGWEFLFLGANMDAVAVAGQMGISKERAAEFVCDSEGLEANCRSVSMAMQAFCMDEAIADDWSQEIRKDRRRRR